MMMPWLGVFVFEDRFTTLNVDQVARFESILLRETLANKELLRNIEEKTKGILSSGTQKT
jgi:hypothetical protein